MPNKRHVELDPLDRLLRSAIPVTDSDGVQLRIDKIVGFELFNTRSYHNYETWSDGYRVRGPIDSRGWSAMAAFKTAAEFHGLSEEATRQLWRAATGDLTEGLLTVEGEDLDDALHHWIANRAKTIEILAEDPPAENQTTRLAVLGYRPFTSPAESTARGPRPS